MLERLDALQQALFEIGSSVYQQANSEDSANTYTPDYEPVGGGLNGATEQDDDVESFDEFDFEHDETVTADYEAID
jgi:molecular chaperone DnaK